MANSLIVFRGQHTRQPKIAGMEPRPRPYTYAVFGPPKNRIDKVYKRLQERKQPAHKEGASRDTSAFVERAVLEPEFLSYQRRRRSH